MFSSHLSQKAGEETEMTRLASLATAKLRLPRTVIRLDQASEPSPTLWDAPFGRSTHEAVRFLPIPTETFHLPAPSPPPNSLQYLGWGLRSKIF